MDLATAEENDVAHALERAEEGALEALARRRSHDFAPPDDWESDRGRDVKGVLEKLPLLSWRLLVCGRSGDETSPFVAESRRGLRAELCLLFWSSSTLPESPLGGQGLPL